MKRKSWIVVTAFVLILAGASGAYLLHHHKQQQQRQAAARQNASKTRLKVYLIGLDGASWNLLKGPLEQGKLPNFRRLMQNGTYGPLKTLIPTKSPILWTSIATGKTMRKHGIGSFTAEKDGKMIPVSGGQRITKAYWNILTDYGVRVGVVNWWVTWPPEKVNGFMVSDRYRNGVNKKTEGMELTYPAELIKELPKVGISQKRYLEDRQKFGLPAELHPEAESKNIDKMVQGYKAYWAQDKAVRETCRRLLAKDNVEVFGVVFRIIDVSSHLFWTYLPMDLVTEMRDKYAKGTLTQADIDRIDAEYSKLIAPIYIYADHILGEFLRKADPTTHIIICSDHGFKFDDGRYGHSSMKIPPDGVFILSGPAFKKNYRLEGPTILDITPTLLYLEGIPVGKDMDGKPILDAFEPGFVKMNQPKLIASHDKPGEIHKGEVQASGQDEQILKDLRALGYIQ